MIMASLDSALQHYPGCLDHRAGCFQLTLEHPADVSARSLRLSLAAIEAGAWIAVLLAGLSDRHISPG